MFDKLDKFFGLLSSNIFFGDVFCNKKSTLNLRVFALLCFHIYWLVLSLVCDFSRSRQYTKYAPPSCDQLSLNSTFEQAIFKRIFYSAIGRLLAKWCRSNVQFKCMTRNVHLFFFGFLLSCKKGKKIFFSPREEARQFFNFRRTFFSFSCFVSHINFLAIKQS